MTLYVVLCLSDGGWTAKVATGGLICGLIVAIGLGRGDGSAIGEVGAGEELPATSWIGEIAPLGYAVGSIEYTITERLELTLASGSG
jgi:hypothetical protein